MTKYIDEDGLSYFMELIKDAYGPTDGASVQTVQKLNITRSGSAIDTMTLGASLTLDPGVYILFGYWVFNTGSSGTRNNQIAIGKSSSDFYIRHRVFAATSNWAALTTSCPVVLTETTTVYVMGSASQTQVSGYLDSSRIWAIKIPENGSGGNLVVKSGTHAAVSVNANSYVDFTIDFGHTFPEPPGIAVNFNTTSTAGAFGNCTFAVNSVTTTGATVRVFNGDTTLRTPSFRWIAVGKAASGIGDYVIDQGTSGTWTWRKWKSGKVEAWGTQSYSSAKSNVWVNNIYYRDLTVSFPSGVFTTAPTYVYVSSLTTQYWASVSGATSSSCTVRLCRPNDTSFAAVVSVYAISFAS